MYNPVATYRIQFHKDFSFKDFEQTIAYLKELGITTVYASPVFKAVPGSVHGYDGVNPLQINPEIGTAEQLRTISKHLKQEGIGWLQDIVPNHMAFHPQNEWLMDVLEKGQLSLYASFFDINWKSKLHQGRVIVPFLGSTLEEVVKNGEVELVSKDTGLFLQYYDSAYPVHPRSYSTIVQNINSPAIDKWKSELASLLVINEAAAFTAKWKELKDQWTSLQKENNIKATIDQAIAAINADKQQLLKVANEQVYALCHWQETDYQINYRRFFTVNGLICLNIQEQNVFDHYHQLVNTLVKEGVFDGLRIDHIDGLYDPTQYLERLQQMAGDETYIVVEKILEPKEALPTSWTIQGNTGYDFLSMVNNLLTNKQAEKALTTFYQQITNNWQSIHQQINEKKAYILNNHMAGELENLYNLFVQLKIVDHRYLSNVHPDDMKAAIGEFLIQCPVYRYYGNQLPLSTEEATAVQDVLNRMKKGGAHRTAVEILERTWLHKPHEGNEDYNRSALQFYQRCMQFTGPLMAKGVEDTLMYTYHRFIGHNEVGDSPEAFGHTPEIFHQMMAERQAQWPLSLNATSTHDTKRGEDARARLNVLTDLHEEWIALVKEWQRMNRALKVNNAPDVNDEYFIYQSLLGCYPMPQQEEDDFTNRFQQYLEKALREAKVHSNWTTPDQAYETAAKEFASHLVDQTQPFWKSFQPFFTKVADFGIINSLAQVLLKFTCPGTPDVYQGCELWDLSFVDPDNRRPVNYAKRHQWLEQLSGANEEEAGLWQTLWNDRYTGRIKLWLVQQLLQLRKQYPDLFSNGEYIPLEVHGKYKEHILAFARKQEQNALIVVVPLHTALICKEQQNDLTEIDWKDTSVALPFAFGQKAQSLLAGTELDDVKELRVRDLFQPIPFAIVRVREEVSVRGAGILMHITSLPSPFGIGDMGPEAKAFANFLHRSQQKFWQLLPLNPTEGGQGHSPYSAISSKAGNPLLISPDWLANAGLLDASQLKKYHLPLEATANYAKAEEIKKELFGNAFANFQKTTNNPLQEAFAGFCQQEADWLDDFALYVVLKAEHGGKPWYEWEEDYKLHDKAALEKLAKAKEQDITKAKWLQFIFAKQWHELKEYCNSRNIQLIGDLPFYVSYDSVDVWANREFFALNEEGNRTGMAGVPPDAFSDDGQLWGMPVFKWDVLKEDGYTWWIERLRKNTELFDLIRLDHFRAFAAYWDVPEGETTAKNGVWKPGPGHDFFEAVEKALGELPFVAEDLGDIDDAVYELRDAFRMPGMKVLQFAFGEDMPRSTHIPHLYSSPFIAYTGTHDNNTVVGWYEQEADAGTKRRLEQYIGKSVSKSSVHWELGRLAYASVANIVILPLQDVLGLDGSARMNKPSSGENNWAWRLVPGQLTSKAEHQLKEWVYLYNR